MLEFDLSLLVVVLLWRLLHWHCILLRRRLLLDQRLMLATILRVSGRRNIVLEIENCEHSILSTLCGVLRYFKLTGGITPLGVFSDALIPRPQDAGTLYYSTQPT
jgi:hypothetical protein